MGREGGGSVSTASSRRVPTVNQPELWVSHMTILKKNSANVSWLIIHCRERKSNVGLYVVIGIPWGFKAFMKAIRLDLS